jgi:ATP-dependent DNA ligase
MTADVRDFKNFRTFGGSINAETGNYEFPMLFHKSDSGKVRQWQIFVRLIKADSKDTKETKKQNWNLLAENQVPLHAEYLEDDSKLPDGLLSQVWAESGYVGMRISRYAPTYPKITNKSRSNERNVFHQGLVLARSKYLKKMEEGSGQDLSLNKGNRFFPMLAKHYEGEDTIKYPIYIQPKLDGIRCLAYLDKAEHTTYKDVILYTRQKHDIPFSETNDNIRKSLLKVLQKFYTKESVYLDGELYKHGKNLQSISSMIRNSSSEDTTEYHIYDMFYPSYTDDGFDKRTKLLSEIYGFLNDEEKTYIKLVPTHLIENKKEADDLYKSYIKKKYEGVMVRTPDGPYAKSSQNKSSALRSKNLLKRKQVFDGEYEVVDFIDGKKGKDRNAIVWICQADNGKLFNVVPNITYEERYKLYDECLKKFDSKYKNRLLTIEFRSLSKDRVPQHSRGIAFRDFS